MQPSDLADYQGQLKLLVVQPTPFCNIDCKYCYLADRSDKRRMTPETLVGVLKHLCEDNLIGEELDLCWHLGEPLAVGIQYYEEMLPQLEAFSVGRFRIEHTFQTNGTLITEDWCQLFKQYNAKVGVSIDGPKHLHDRNRVTRRGHGTFDQAVAGLKLLQKHHISRYIIAVLDGEALRTPDSIFDFFAELGETNICFNIEESEGIHTSTTASSPQSPERVRRFFARLLERIDEGSTDIWVRELQQMLGVLMTVREGACANENNAPFRIISVAWNGQWTTFSPELITTHAPQYDDFKFGNLADAPISADISNSALPQAFSDIQTGIERCRDTCDYFRMCGGGSPSNKFSELGTLSGCETFACRTMIKSLADGCMDFIEDRVARAN